MKSEFVDFKTVKSAVSMEMALQHYRITLKRVNRLALRGQCPLPMHTSKGETSFGVHTGKNVWACQSDSCIKARGGRRGGNVLDFVASMEACSIRDAALKLANWFNVQSEGTRPAHDTTQSPNGASAQLVSERKREGEVTEDILADAENKPLGFELRNIDHLHPYLTARGLTLETVARFGVGFFGGKGSMAGRIVIPIHNEAGHLVAYAGRAIDQTEPKYKLPAGFRKSLELFNLHKALEHRGGTVIVVEGFFDAMNVHQARHANVVALMGCTLSDAQQKLLVENFSHVVLMLDGDEVGREAANVIAGQLVSSIFVKVINLPDGKQPDQLSGEQLQSILG